MDRSIQARNGLRWTSFTSARINYMQNQLVYVQRFFIRAEFALFLRIWLISMPLLNPF